FGSNYYKTVGSYNCIAPFRKLIFDLHAVMVLRKPEITNVEEYGFDIGPLLHNADKPFRDVGAFPIFAVGSEQNGKKHSFHQNHPQTFLILQYNGTEHRTADKGEKPNVCRRQKKSTLRR